MKVGKPRRPRPVELGEVSAEHVATAPGLMLTLNEETASPAGELHAGLDDGPGGFADYMRTGDQWQVTIMVVGRPRQEQVRCKEIPSLQEAFVMAVRLAAPLLPLGATLLHAMDGSAPAWIPTYLAEYGCLPTSDSAWTAVVDSAEGDHQERSRSYIGTTKF